MTGDTLTFRNGRIFDGARCLDGHVAQYENGQLVQLGPEAEIPRHGTDIDLAGDILFPGFVDLQVNGGGGILFNADPSVATLRRMAEAHRALGVTAFLPTLITDTPETTRAAVAATAEALREGVPGIAGLHLEGPHLSVARKGAHDAALIRPMAQADLDALLDAKRTIPVLKMTVAPESVTEDQVATMAAAGILVALGHSDADYATCRRYMDAGARCVTHLFNAMSQLGNREPGLVGAALACGTVSAGLIADAVHVHPATIRAAWTAKTGPGRIYLVSDAMAVAGSDATEFELGGRVIRRHDGRLTLEDGTLAGADLDLATAVRVMVTEVGIDLPEALAAATSVPAGLIDLTYSLNSLSQVTRLASDLSGTVPVTG
ncbi:MAG: N-acetylglucosamine-6-phosphate deacetylase [Marivita sp.]|uniref:N-acetylglucosamine-6-phosphate deacetylase n=1 Tax=Marivita sp. TaxID=2003365 RepID=UPI0025C3AF64|nr:N-acetylglucosamine-6-phosphate deacetylase [Marivita sp.]MCI5110727.1 N-acetylglucosamine-6-phosphate deacetylase [Marivita sp.]